MIQILIVFSENIEKNGRMGTNKIRTGFIGLIPSSHRAATAYIPALLTANIRNTPHTAPVFSKCHSVVSIAEYH